MATTGVSAADQVWLDVFEATGAAVRAATAGLLGTEAGRAEIGVGAGGDHTVELDRAAEEAALAELRRFAADGHPCSVLSEEAGVVDLGAPWPPEGLPEMRLAILPGFRRE